MRSALLLALLLTACGKQALPVGCTEADFVALASTCGPTQEDCDREVDERQAQCSEKVKAE